MHKYAIKQHGPCKCPLFDVSKVEIITAATVGVPAIIESGTFRVGQVHAGFK